MSNRFRGNTVNIVLRAWDIINQTSSENLHSFKPQIFTASGNQVEVKGKVCVMIDLCGILCITDVIVAEDMTIKRILSEDGGKVELHLKYSVE